MRRGVHPDKSWASISELAKEFFSEALIGLSDPSIREEDCVRLEDENVRVEGVGLSSRC